MEETHNCNFVLHRVGNQNVQVLCPSLTTYAIIIWPHFNVIWPHFNVIWPHFNAILPHFDVIWPDLRWIFAMKCHPIRFDNIIQFSVQPKLLRPITSRFLANEPLTSSLWTQSDPELVSPWPHTFGPSQTLSQWAPDHIPLDPVSPWASEPLTTSFWT